MDFLCTMYCTYQWPAGERNHSKQNMSLVLLAAKIGSQNCVNLYRKHIEIKCTGNKYLKIMVAQQQKIYSIEFLTWKQNMESNNFCESIVILHLFFQGMFLEFLNYDSIVKFLCLNFPSLDYHSDIKNQNFLGY